MRRRAGLLMLVTLVACATGCERASPLHSAANGQDSGDGVRDRVQQQLGDIPEALDTVSAARLSSAFRAAAAHALPAVVRITTVTLVDPATLPFHPAVENGTQRTQGTGSGFIIDQRGYILTNHHVVQNALNVHVALLDGREFTAQVIGTDPSTDVAVIRVDNGERELPTIELGDSDQLRVGDWVIALGNPLGLTFTATAGIVSAKGRNIGILEQGNPSTALEAFIQTDAAINPGNSGGPLVDLNGRVIGINTAIQSQTGFFTGAGFAIPIALAHKVANDLIEHGVVHRPRLGISIQDVTAADAEVYNLATVSGVEVTSLTPGEAADRAGMQLGDVINTIDSQPVNTTTELQSRVALFQPGDRIRVGFTRYGKPLETTVVLGEFETARAERVQEPAARPANPLGFTVTALPAAVARRLGFDGDQLPVVSDIDPLAPAASSGLGQYDIIRRFNGRDIRSIADLERAARGMSPGQVLSLIVVNARQAQQIPRIVNYRIQ